MRVATTVTYNNKQRFFLHLEACQSTEEVFTDNLLDSMKDRERPTQFAVYPFGTLNKKLIIRERTSNHQST